MELQSNGDVNLNVSTDLAQRQSTHLAVILGSFFIFILTVMAIYAYFNPWWLPRNRKNRYAGYGNPCAPPGIRYDWNYKKFYYNTHCPSKNSRHGNGSNCTGKGGGGGGRRCDVGKCDIGKPLPTLPLPCAVDLPRGCPRPCGETIVEGGCDDSDTGAEAVKLKNRRARDRGGAMKTPKVRKLRGEHMEKNGGDEGGRVHRNAARNAAVEAILKPLPRR